MASDTELWRGTDYGWWLAADTSGAVGASLIAFAVPLMMLATTGSSAAATTTESICVVVQTVLGLAGGVIQDRYDRRTLMLIWGASGVMLSAVAAAAVMLFGNAPKTSGHGVNGANAPAFGGPYAHVLPIALLCIVVLFSVRDGLLENTSNAMLRGVVPDEQLPHAMALNDARDSTVTLAGGPLGGLLMTVGHAVLFLTSAVLSVLGMVSAWRIRRYWKRATVDDSGHSGNADDAADDAIDVSGAITAAPRWRDALDGMIWLLRDRFQRHLIIAATMVTGASNAFLLLTALDISQGGSQLISAGFINAASAVGMLLGALMASQLVNRVPRRRTGGCDVRPARRRIHRCRVGALHGWQGHICGLLGTGIACGQRGAWRPQQYPGGQGQARPRWSGQHGVAVRCLWRGRGTRRLGYADHRLRSDLPDSGHCTGSCRRLRADDAQPHHPTHAGPLGRAHPALEHRTVLIKGIRYRASDDLQR